ncbi:MAG: metallophosphoesterase [Candidatus Aenigmatarchaeota archaeon]
MKILTLADFRGNIEATSKLLNTLDMKDIGLVLCSGDFTDAYNVPYGFSVLNMGEVIVQKIASLKKPFFCVPGNVDPFDIVSVFADYGANIHHHTKKVKELEIAGWGGAVTPFNTNFEPPPAETKQGLEDMAKKIKGEFILLLHDPPKDTKLDLLDGKHVGSKEERDFILDKKPVLCVSGHIHEARGTDKLGSTILFNPGSVSDGCYGIVDITGKKVTCELKKFT